MNFNSTNTRKTILIIVAAAVIVCVILTLFATWNKTNSDDLTLPANIEDLFELGEKYLLDMDYEPALVHFMKVIEIEPKNPRGYTGAAEAYLGLEQNSKAKDILEQGVIATHGDKTVKDKLDEVEELIELERSTQDNEPEPQPEPEPPSKPPSEPEPPVDGQLTIGDEKYSIELTELDLYAYEKITDEDIASLKYMTNLTHLGIYNDRGAGSMNSGKISDISALGGLTNLTSLHLSGSQISDISALSSLTNLTELNLYGNQISDINALRGLTKLTGLQLYDNQIDDISALSKLTNLNVLHLDSNKISDISALSKLTNLTDLYISNNQISDSQIKELQTALPKCKIHY